MIVLVNLLARGLLDTDSYRCPMSLRSELRLIRRLLKLGTTCLSPKLKGYAPELEKRKLKLLAELKLRGRERRILLAQR